MVTNVPLWSRTSLVGEVVHVWGQGVYGNSLYVLLNAVVNLNCSKNICFVFNFSAAPLSLRDLGSPTRD